MTSKIEQLGLGKRVLLLRKNGLTYEGIGKKVGGVVSFMAIKRFLDKNSEAIK